MKLAWLIDANLVAEEQPDLVSHIKSLGYPVHKLSSTLDMPKIQYEPECVYAFLGSFEELRRVQKHCSISVATYGLNKLINRSGYVSYIPNDCFLNADSIMITWGQLANHPSRFFDMFKTDRLFVRPDSGSKTFSGQVFETSTILEEMKFLDRYSSVAPKTIIWVGGAKTIEQEYRFWISAGKVVTWSEYSWDKTPVNNSVPPSKIVMDMAEQVANYEWQVDRIYTIDITEHHEVAKIIELNSFSCAGLYNCDGKKLLETVSRDILAEWED